MQLNIHSKLFVLATFLVPAILARCPVCFDNTVRGCDGLGPDSLYYTCYKSNINAMMVSTFTCEGGCRYIMGEPRCNNGRFKNDMIALPVDPTCPWGLRGRTPTAFTA